MQKQETASVDDKVLLEAALRVKDKYEALWLKEIMRHVEPKPGEPAPPNNYWQAEHIAHKKFEMAASIVEAIKDAMD